MPTRRPSPPVRSASPRTCRIATVRGSRSGSVPSGSSTRLTLEPAATVGGSWSHTTPDRQGCASLDHAWPIVVVYDPITPRVGESSTAAGKGLRPLAGPARTKVAPARSVPRPNPARTRIAPARSVPGPPPDRTSRQPARSPDRTPRWAEIAASASGPRMAPRCPPTPVAVSLNRDRRHESASSGTPNERREWFLV